MLEDKKKKMLQEFLNIEIQRIGASLSTSESYDFLKEVELLEKNRTDFISRYRSIPFGCESFFVVLRKWNSYTPSLPALYSKKETLTQHSIGGGYFLFVQGPENALDSGYGLVIDPGYNFIHNFGLAGFCLDDIDGILITHAHNDHTNDFESLLSLLYQRNTKYIGRRKPKKVDLFLNVGSFKKFSNYLDLAHKDSKNYIGKVTVMSPGQVVNLPNRDNLECEIITLHTNHHEIITADYSLGICFKIAGRNLLLTGDTGWTFNTAEKNEALLKENNVFTRDENTSNNIDVLVCHIGTIKREEFNIKNNGRNFESFYYDKHLGILGTISIIEQWKPELCIISEFGEELTQIRESLVKEVEISSKKLYPNLRCLPGDIGLFICLDSRKSLCYLTGKLIEWNNIAYKDIEDEYSQRSIKYFDGEELKKLRDSDIHLQKIKIADGVNAFREYYLKNVVIQSFQLQGKSKEDIKKEISEITIDYLDPFDVEEGHLKVVGRIIALSCIISDPLELLDTLTNVNNTDLILTALTAYNINTEILDKFVFNCVKEGYADKNKSTAETVLYEANKDFIPKFIDSFKRNDLEAAKDFLDKINKSSIKGIWDSLSETIKVDILFENKGDYENIEIAPNKKRLSFYINKYFSLLENFENDVHKLKKSLPPRASIYHPEIYREEEYFNYLEEENISRSIKEVEKKINIIKENLKSFSKKHSEIFDKMNIRVPIHTDSIKVFFYILNQIFIEIEQGKRPDSIIKEIDDIFTD